MENVLKKLSAEFRANLEIAMGSKAVKDLVEATKAAEDSGTFEVVISTADDDRSGESVTQAGIDLTLYKMNPIVLWGHDYYALPIGVCDSIEVVEGKLVAKGRFAPADANPFAQQVRKLYDAKIVRATSIGFIVKEMEGNIISKSELLEFSFVPVPANPYALSLSHAKTLGLDTAMLAMKGLNNVLEKEVAEDTTTETPVESETTVEETPAEVVEEKSIKALAGEELAQAVGAELASMQSIIDAALSDSTAKIMALIAGEEAREDETTEESEEEKAATDGVTPESEAVESAKGDTEKAQKEFEQTRLILRALATATTNALEGFNKKARAHEDAK